MSLTRTVDPHALPQGYQLGDYSIERVLGRGGFAYTYLATSVERDNSLSYMAIKELFPEGVIRVPGDHVHAASRKEEEMFAYAKERFKAEAVALKKCRHPNIVRILDYFPWNNTAYIVMEYEDGEQLGKCIQNSLRNGGYSETQILNILLPLLDGLAHVHAQRVYHRDIKPENIYLTANDRAVLLDFGAAQQLSEEHRHSKGENSQLVISTGYSPFEQYHFSGHVGPWTDVYALGAVVHQMITGTPPPSADQRAYFAKSTGDPYQRLHLRSDVAGRYSPGFLKAIDWALEPEIERRPGSTAEWRSCLANRSLETPLNLDNPAVPEVILQPPSSEIDYIGRTTKGILLAMAFLITVLAMFLLFAKSSN